MLKKKEKENLFSETPYMIRIGGFLISLGQQQNHIGSSSSQDTSCNIAKYTHTHLYIKKRLNKTFTFHANYSEVKFKKTLKCKLNALNTSPSVRLPVM